MSEPLLEYIRFKTPQTWALQTIGLLLSTYDLKGDWLNDPPDLSTAYWFCKSVVDETLASNRSKTAMHNPIEIIRMHNRIVVRTVGIMPPYTELAYFIFQEL